MLINALLQDVQSCFKNDSLIPKVLTKLYKSHSQFVLESPVALRYGYGFATGKSKTYRERIDRFVKILRSSFDTFKYLYSVDMNYVAGMLFLYDLGAANASDEVRIACEKNNKLDICGQTVILLQNAIVDEQIGIDLNQLMVYIPVLYRRLAGDLNIMKSVTEIVLAADIIQMDKRAIESIKERVNGQI